MNKRRILFVGEASYLGTGFSVYANELLKRLYQLPDLEFAELGSYAYANDPRCKQVPWKFYPVFPNSDDAEAMAHYDVAKYPTHQFGDGGVFDRACLDWKPDLVIEIRDPWMSEFVLRSPYRNNYKFLWMATIDGEPCREIWLDWYRQTDGLLTYSDYAMNLLKRHSRPGTNVLTKASPGTDLDVFKPVPDKRLHKQRMGIDPNALIVGTICRNQKRKILYDLIESFSIWLHKAKTKGHLELVKRTFLYLHTSYPDVGYDIGKAIQDFKVGGKVLMTYFCTKCGAIFPNHFSGELTTCRKCREVSAMPPNANRPIPREALAGVTNLFDLYVQYSICLHPKTPILLDNCIHKNIDEIKAGDKIVSYDGKIREVEWCKQTQSKSQTVDIKTYGHSQIIICTPDHEILTIDNDHKLKYLPAKEICGKWVVYPISREGSGVFEDKEFLFIAGSYIANGGKNSIGSISFSYNPQKEKTAKRIETWWDSQNIHHKRTYHNVADEFRIIVSNTKITKQFENDFGNGAPNKKIPQWMMKLDPHDQKYLIQGLFFGDGCISNREKTKRGYTFNYSTTSELLAFQTRELLLRQNVGCSIQIEYRPPERLPLYHINTNDTKMFDILDIPKPPNLPKYKPKFIKIMGNYLAMKVTSVTTSEYTGPVYDLAVDITEGGDANSRSFVANHFVTHNCEG